MIVPPRAAARRAPPSALRAPPISGHPLRIRFPFIVHGAERPSASLIADRNLPLPPLARLRFCLLEPAGLAYGGPAPFVGRRSAFSLGLKKRPAVGAGEAAPLPTTTRTTGMGQRPGPQSQSLS